MKYDDLPKLIRFLKFLKDNSIKLKTTGCGCCGSPGLEIEMNGESFYEPDCLIDMSKDYAIQGIDLEIEHNPTLSVGEKIKLEHQIKIQALIDNGYNKDN
jgi:hypothetical protein